MIPPKFRDDLLESAAVVERMLAGEIETTVVPSTCWTWSPSRVVAMAALDDWRVEDLAALLRRGPPVPRPGPALAGGRARCAE